MKGPKNKQLLSDIQDKKDAPFPETRRHKMYSHYRPGPKVRYNHPPGGNTQQHFKDECDINSIMKRKARTGILAGPQGRGAPSQRQPFYGDFSGVTDFATALNAVIESQDSFNALSSDLRKRFNNNPQELLEFVMNEENREKAQEMGLIPTPEVEKPVEVVLKDQKREEPPKGGDDRAHEPT